MRRFRALLRKEWRDHRTLVLVSAVLIAAVVIGARMIFGEGVDSELRTLWILPGCLALVLAAVASDSAARESNDGVGDALGRLPVSARVLWAAKIVFLALAGLAFQTWLVLLEVGMRLGFPEDSLTPLLRPGLWPWTAASTGAVFAFAVLLRRSFPGALLGLGIVIGVPVGWFFLPDGVLRDWLLVGIDPWSPAWIAVVAGLAFLLASVFAYSPWCARGNDWTRRVFPGLAGVALVLGPAIGASAVRAIRRVDLVPHATGFTLSATASPDGRFVVLWASSDFHSTWRETEGLWRNFDISALHDLNEVWVLDRSDGSLHEIDGRPRSGYPMGTRGSTLSPWGLDGKLRTWSTPGPFWRTAPGRLEVVDPSNGTIVSHVAVRDDGDMSTFVSEAGFSPWYELEGTSEDRTRVTWTGRGITAVVPAGSHLAISPEPGVIFYDDSGELVRHDLERGSVQSLIKLKGRITRPKVSPDGGWIFLYDGESTIILDSSSGAQLIRPILFPSWSRSPGRVCYTRDKDGWFVIDEAGGERRLEVPDWVQYVEDLGPDQLLGTGYRPEYRLAALDLEGHLVEMLYETAE